MKKIVFTFSAVVTLSLGLTGCLKDKNFDDNKYGIENPSGSPDGVGLTLGRSAIETRGLEVTGSTQTVTDLLILNLFSEVAAKSDVTVTLTTDTTIVNSYNTANGTSIQKLPAASLSLPRTQFTIKAGTRVDTIPVNIPTTLALDPNKSYGVGFRITTASSGYTIASNYSTILLQINIKNKYDGKYSLKGFFVRTDLAAYNNPFSTNVQLVTTGPASVGLYWALINPAGYYQPFSNAGSLTAFSNVAPNFVFNPTTNKVISINNLTGTPPMTPFPGYDSRYDPSTKTIFVKYYYNTDPTNRIFTDTLVYTGPR